MGGRTRRDRVPGWDPGSGGTPAAPFLKWAGGKTQLLERYVDLYPARFGTYHEPFVGGGAVFFHLARLGRVGAARLADVNPDLVLTYRVVRDEVESLIERLGALRDAHDADHYYAAREAFNADDGPPEGVARAALVIYLNKTCFNGLYRVNRKGHFNVPLGRYVNPQVFDAAQLRACSAALREAVIDTADFDASLESVEAGDFVYLDPPYVPITETAYFTAYAKEGFGFEEQRRLARTFRTLAERGAKVMLSNHHTPELVALFEGFDVRVVPAKRRINSRADRRDDDVAEVIIRNYR